jgi:hypothetical protein
MRSKLVVGGAISDIDGKIASWDALGKKLVN